LHNPRGTIHANIDWVRGQCIAENKFVSITAEFEHHALACSSRMGRREAYSPGKYRAAVEDRIQIYPLSLMQVSDSDGLAAAINLRPGIKQKALFSASEQTHGNSVANHIDLVERSAYQRRVRLGNRWQLRKQRRGIDRYRAILGIFYD
jgi:hypothetical protein